MRSVIHRAESRRSGAMLEQIGGFTLSVSSKFGIMN